MEHYNVGNEKIYVVTCLHCGNQVDVTDIYTMGTPNGFRNLIGLNTLEFADKLAECCENPNYAYDEGW